MLPWVIATVLAVMLGIFLYTSGAFQSPQVQTIITQNTILTEVESIGKLEMVRYNFRDITELEQKGRKDYFDIINWGEDANMALISIGSAVGCIDLRKIKEENIIMENDTVYVCLPDAELCNYKLDMEKTHIYALKTGRRVDAKKFIQKGYTKAEQRIQEAALESGILDQTTQNAELILRPLLEKISGKPVVFTKLPAPVKGNLNK